MKQKLNDKLTNVFFVLFRSTLLLLLLRLLLLELKFYSNPTIASYSMFIIVQTFDVCFQFKIVIFFSPSLSDVQARKNILGPLKVCIGPVCVCVSLAKFKIYKSNFVTKSICGPSDWDRSVVDRKMKECHVLSLSIPNSGFIIIYYLFLFSMFTFIKIYIK